MSLKEKVMTYLQSDKRRSIKVTEFDEEVFFTPITVLEMQKLRTMSSGGTDVSAMHVFTIIEKCQDSEGKKIFGIEDKPFLEQMPWNVIVNLSNEILGSGATPEETKKN